MLATWLTFEVKAETLTQLSASDYQLGEKTYLVYMVNDETQAIRMSQIWKRSTEVKEYQNKPSIYIKQHWTSSDGKSDREIYSYNDIDTFAPQYHWSKNAKGESAYTFTPDKVVGDNSLPGNSKADFEMTSQAPFLNWELDIETFQLLDYAEGRTFSLNFYHPGSKTPPGYYQYKVIGSDSLVTAGKHSIDCWQLYIDYGKGSYATFWIDKDTKQMIKMEEKWGKFTRYKYLLPN